MLDWFGFIELVTGFTTILLSFSFLLLVHYVLHWLPSKNFLIFLLAIGIILKSTIFARELFDSTISLVVFILSFPLILLLGPVLSSFTRSTLRMERMPTMDWKMACLLGLGYLLILPLFILTIAGSNEQTISYLPLLTIVGTIAFVILFAISSSWHFVPMLWRLSKGSLYSVGYGENTYHWLRGIWLSISAIWLMLLFDTISEFFFQVDTVWHHAVFAILDLAIWVALLFFTAVYCRKPNQDQEVQHCEASEKYEKSALGSILATQILEDVDKLMLKQQPYLDSSITLEKIASMVNAKPQYLSQAINQYREVNFYEFIAKYRIDFARSELTHDPSKSILDIAMSAGFNAKSTFNLTFKKIIGLTPSSYRKQQLT